MEENRRTRKKNHRSKGRTNNKLKPHVTPSPGIEPEPHWWEASAKRSRDGGSGESTCRMGFCGRYVMVYSVIYLSKRLAKDWLNGLQHFVKINTV